MRKISTLALALSILAVSCNKEADKVGSVGAEAGAINVTARVNNVTRATTEGAVTTFEYGDQLTLYVWTGDNTTVPAERWIDGEVLTYNETTLLWEPEKLMKWKNLTDAHYFLGVYPARAITNFTADPFEQNLDPAAKYDINDLLVATILGDGVKASVVPVPLTMDHLMAKLNVTLKFRDQWGGIPDKVAVSVKGSATGTVDYISKTVTPGNDVAQMPVVWRSADLQAPVTYYSSYVIPQTGITEVVVNVNGTEYVYTHPSDIPFAKGHVTTLPLIVGKDAIVLADEGITVGDWTEGALPAGLGENTVVVPNDTDLGTIKADYVASDGETLFGTLDVEHYPVKISIANGATVTLDGVTISGANNSSYQWAGLNCEGNATIILKDGTTNTVKGFYENWPGIYVPEGSTLTIQGETLGTGKLIASSNGYGCGIGGGWNMFGGSIGNINIEGGNVTATGGIGGAGIGGGNTQSCGAISITGGTITSTGGKNGAGIGSGRGGSCVSINISGGTVTATGGDNAAGIGGGGTTGSTDASCGDITITSGVTKVTAQKGSGASNSIGAGIGICGTVTIGGVVGAITDSPYIYPEPPKNLADATAEDVGKVIAADGKIYINAEAATNASTTAVAVIAYVGTAGSVDASSASYKGLAIALSDANSGSNCQWAESYANCLSSSQTSDISTALGFKNGIACTSTLTSDGHTHAAATAAASNNGTAAPTGASGWFMPSMGQWNLIVQGLATKKAGSAVTTDLTTSENNTYKANNLNSVITDAGGTEFQSRYWASTEQTHVRAWAIYFSNGCASNYSKNNNYYVRSVLAF